MLTGPELGKAIESARALKGVTKKAMADHFRVTPPSVQDWVKRGTIDKDKLVALWAYFSDVVGPEHWGLPWHYGPAPTTLTDLAAALPVVLARLPGLDDYTADQVLGAVRAAMRPAAPLERIEDDLLRWLEARPAGAPPAKRTGTD